MPQDAYTLKYLCFELNDILANGKVNRITQTDNDRLFFTIWTGKSTQKLLLDVNPSAPRIGIVQKEEESPLTAPNFCMLLRKHLSSATIKQISIVGFDRIVKIDFSCSAEFFDAKDKTLYVELMGRYSNIILTENNIVLGGNRGVNFFDNGVRPLIVWLPYKYPPVQDKKVPTDTLLVEYFEKFTSIEQSERVLSALPKYIFSGVQGLALLTAQEIVNQFLISNKLDSQVLVGDKGFLRAFSGQKFFNFLNNFTQNSTLNPCVFYDGQEVKDVCVYPYALINLSKKSFEKLYLAEDYYYAQKNKLKSYKLLKDRLNSVVASAQKKVKKKLTAISNRIKEASDLENNKLCGELILANIYQIKSGCDNFVANNYYNNSKLKISLDANLSPAENAERYYKKYNKQKRSLLMLTPQKQQAESELNYIESIINQLNLAEEMQDLIAIKSELIQLGLIEDKNKVVKNGKSNKKEQQSFYREYQVLGFTIRVGRNNVENDRLTFSAKPNDIWLHAKKEHSAHVIITCQTAPSDEVIGVAAEICAYYSNARQSGKTEIVWTKKKNVSKPSGAKAGFVTYSDFQSAYFVPVKHEEFIKLD